MKKFVFALVTMLIACGGLFAQQKSTESICYVGSSLDRIKKDFPAVRKLEFKDIYRIDFVYEALSNYEVYEVSMGDRPNSRLFYIKDGKCQTEALFTQTKMMAMAYSAIYSNYFGTEHKIDDKHAWWNLKPIPNNSNTLTFTYNYVYSQVYGWVYVMYVKNANNRV